MKKTLFLIIFLWLFQPALQAQYVSFDIAPGIHLPADSTLRTALLTSLNTFLQSKEMPNHQNELVWKTELPATSVLLDEMKEMERYRNRQDSQDYKAFLSNAALLTDSNYLIQVSYLGVKDSEPVHRATFSFMAKKEGNRFCFYAPLTRNTSGWKAHKRNGITFFYKKDIDIAKADEYEKWNALYLGKLGRPDHQTRVYCCDDFQEALQITGVNYKADYNGSIYNSLSATEDHLTVVVSGTLTGGFLRFDPHDMWHEKLRIVIPAQKINKAVDEGCAFLYGGSWGLSWEEIKSLFKAYAQKQPDPDWLQLYLNGTDFKEGREPLKISYFINALIVQKIEQEKGMPVVLQLVACGKKEKGDDNYFNMLEKLTGIIKANFNSEVNNLIKDI